VSDANNEILNQLSEARDRAPLSSRNTSKGALVREAHAVFSAIKGGLTVGKSREAIRDGKLLQSATYETRQRVMDLLTYRYFWPHCEWSVQSLAKASEAGAKSAEFLSLAYLYFALRDRFTYEFVVGRIWERWRSKSTSLALADFLTFFDERAEQETHLKKWRESTRRKVGQSMLAALRDFGVLRGTQRKEIQKPAVTPESAFHLLCVLKAEGLDGRGIVEAADWRLFLWTETEVAQTLGELSLRRWIRFEKSGHTVILELLREPRINP
jgi:hypothetical protein